MPRRPGSKASSNLSKALEATGEHDGFAIVAERAEVAVAAIHQVIVRARMAFDGVPNEVRGVRDDRSDENRTEFQRPMPGAARMYPETDIPPVRITSEILEEIELPEMPVDRIARFQKDLRLSQEQAKQLVHGGSDDVFEEICKAFPKLSTIVARTLLNTIPELEDDGIRLEDTSILEPIFKALDAGELAKEGVPDVLRTMLEKGLDVDGALEDLGLAGGPDLEAIRVRIMEIVKENMDLVEKKGLGAVGPLMGKVMKEFKGKADGKALSDMLKQEISAVR